jgi:hypothetical protein
VTTRTNFVLVDFENVQPKDIGLLKDGLTCLGFSDQS